MIEFENVVVIDQPVGEVYNFLADLENLPKWNYFVISVRKQSPGPPGVGARYHQERKSDSQVLTIVEMDVDKLLTLETVPPSKPELKRWIAFEGIDGKTRLTDRWRLDSDQPALLQTIARGKVKSAVKDNLLKLKELLEVGQVVLQDGRHVSI